MIFIVRKIEYNGNKRNWQRVRDKQLPNTPPPLPPENIFKRKEHIKFHGVIFNIRT